MPLDQASIEHYLEAFGTLRKDKSAKKYPATVNHSAPHKPLLLLAVIDRALRSRAPDVLSHDWSAEIHPELHETTLEIGTRVCSSAAELEAQLGRLRFHVSTTAAAEGMRVVAAGGHPFTRWEAHEATEGERYERMLEQYGRVAWDETSFGMHIHDHHGRILSMLVENAIHH
jgi:hypothetical protein